MALSRTTKIWIIILSIPVVLVLAAFAGLKLYLTSERIKGMLIPKAESATHRTVSVRDASFSILPKFSIRLEGLKISNKKGTSFDRDEFLSVEVIEINVKIMELLRERLEIEHLIIEKPKMYLEVTKEGVTNYSEEEEGAPKGNVRTEVSADKSGMLLLSDFEIRDAVLEYYDKKDDTRMIIAGYTQTGSVTKASGTDVISIKAKASIRGLSFGTLSTLWLKEAPLQANGTMSFLPATQTLKLENVTASLGDLPMTMTGSISNMFETRMFDITINTANGEMKQVLSLIPPEMLKAAQGMTSSGTVNGVVTMKGESSDDIQPEVQGTFSVANGTVQYSSLPKSVTNINISGMFTRPAGERKNPPAGTFELSKFSASLGTNTISGAMSMKDFNDPVVKAQCNGVMNLNEVKEFYPLEQGSEFSGAMKGNVSLEGKAKSPETIKASGSVDFQNATVRTATSKSPVKDLNGMITFNNQSIESKKLSMTMGESDLALAFTMKNYLGMVMKSAEKAGKPSASVTLNSKQLRTADLMSEETPAQQPEGSKPNAPQQAMLLPGMDVDATVSIGKLVTEKFDFTNAKGALAIRDGVINLKNFSVNAFDGTIVSKGTLDMRDSKKRPFNFDLDIKGTQSNAILSKFSSFGNNLFGKLSMSTKLTGALDDTLGLLGSALTGEGNVQVAEGSLKGFALTSSLAAFTGLEELKVINFHDWTNAFSISNGKVNIKDLKVKAGSTDFLVNGAQGLDGSLDYNLNVKLPGSVSERLKLPGVADQLMQFFKDSDGRISLSFLVSGMHTSPSLKLDTKPQEEMAKKALQNKVDEGKKKVEDELKKKLGEGLNNLLKKKPD